MPPELLLGETQEEILYLFQRFASASAQIIRRFDAQCLSNLADAFVLVDHQQGLDARRILLNQIAVHSLGKLDTLKPQRFSNNRLTLQLEDQTINSLTSGLYRSRKRLDNMQASGLLQHSMGLGYSWKIKPLSLLASG